jgi:hypothetical protein
MDSWRIYILSSLAAMQSSCHSAILAASQAIDFGLNGIGAGNVPAFTLRQMVAPDHPVASIAAAKRRNFCHSHDCSF